MANQKITFPDPSTVGDPDIFTSQLSGESDSEYTAFLAYLELPPPRSLPGFRKACPELHGKVKTYRTIAARNQWSVRSRGYDISFARAVLRKTEKSKQTQVMLTWRLMEKAAQRAMETVAHTQHGPAARTFFDALKSVRLMVGEPSERTESTVVQKEELKKLSADDLEDLVRMREKIEGN